MSRPQRIAKAIKRNLVHLPDIVAVIGACVVLTASGFTTINDGSVIQATCALLALLAISQLILRISKIDPIINQLTDLQTSIGESGPLRRHLQEQLAGQGASLAAMNRFLIDGDLESRTVAAFQSVDGYSRRFKQAGIADAYATLGDVDLAAEMRQAERTVRIFSTWTGCLISLGEILVEKARNGCDVRILILRHNSDFARLRGLELDPADAQNATRQIKTEMCEFNRLFRQHPDVIGRIRVKAFDARPPMCMFSHDETRLIGSLWPGVNAMDAPALRVRTTDATHANGLAEIADLAFEKMWADEKSKHIKVVAGEPQYVERPELAWSLEGEHFDSVWKDLERAERLQDSRERARVVESLRRRDLAEVAVLELHEKLISRDAHAASSLVNALSESNKLHLAESVLREAVTSGHLQFLERLVNLLLGAGYRSDAEDFLRRGVAAGNYYAIFRLIKILNSSNRAHQVEGTLRTGAAAGSREALQNLIDLLDRSNRRAEADSILDLQYAEGRRHAGHLIAIREYGDGRSQRALERLKEWANEGDMEAKLILEGLEIT